MPDEPTTAALSPASLAGCAVVVVADKLPIEQPLFSRLVFAPTDPEGPVEDEALSMGLWAYLVLRYGAYLNMLVIFVLSTLTFNLVRPLPPHLNLRSPHPCPIAAAPDPLAPSLPPSYTARLLIDVCVSVC